MTAARRLHCRSHPASPSHPVRGHVDHTRVVPPLVLLPYRHCNGSRPRKGRPPLRYHCRLRRGFSGEQP
eukprot:4406400-Alexandrium_andersonii.AAC.1